MEKHNREVRKCQATAVSERGLIDARLEIVNATKDLILAEGLIQNAEA